MGQTKETKNNISSIPTDESPLPTKTFDYPLIDVDCNLLHSDLTSLLASSPNYGKSKSKYFNILHHPSTPLSNIQCMFSPSSTIDEAEEFHQILLESNVESRNSIEIRMSVGIHPYHTNENEIGTFDDEEANAKGRIKSLLEKDRDLGYITCIGEAGLDYSDGFPDRNYQLPWFEFQLNQAKEYNLPLFIHERLAFDDTISLIDKVFPKGEEGNEQQPKIIIHCFTGRKEELKEYISRGYFISVSGYILKAGDGPNEINQCLKEGIIPLDKLMIETDAPYMGFNKCRESYYEIESIVNEEFHSLKSKKRKNLIKGIYPNVPAALPKVLDRAVESINEGKKERGEVELDMKSMASSFYDNSKCFFGF
jgi:TatD DNase family protein